MSRLHLHLIFTLLLLQYTSSLKILTYVQPYLIQAPSETTQTRAAVPNDDLPVYRDLPPIRTEPKDLSEALEATRNLKITRPPLDTQAFFASLKKAAEEVRSVVLGIAPAFPDIQIQKASVMDLTEKAEGGKDGTKSKASYEPFQATPKAEGSNLQVKRSEGSFVAYAGADSPTLKADSSVDVSVRAPFTDVQVRKLAVEEGGPTEVPIPNTDPTIQDPNPSVGVKVDAPHTNVQVRNDGGYGYGQRVGVRVEAPFTNVKVRKLAADIPAGAVPGPNGDYPDMGVRVEAPFVKVKVDGPAIHKIPPMLEDGIGSRRPLNGDPGLFPRRHGRPLDLDINIPGIFNLKLLRDENGRGRLGIGVLPVITSMVNPNKAAESYPGPPPPS